MFKDTFSTQHDQYAARDGQPFEVVEKITEANDKFDAEVLPMYRIRFEDGEVIDAFPDEVEARYTATYWQDESDLPDGREGVHYIQILDPEGEEYAVIIHRTSKGLYPIGGRSANEKLERSLEICEALNARL